MNNKQTLVRQESPASEAATQPGQTQQFSQTVLDQIKALQSEKASRTPAQRKINSQLLYALKMNRGEAIAKGVQTLNVQVNVKDTGMVLVDIKANVTGALLAKINGLGGQVMSAYKQYDAIRANVPLRNLEKLAASADVKFIRPADQAQTERIDPSETINPNDEAAATSFSAPSTSKRSDFAMRAANVRSQLANALPTFVQDNGGGQTDTGNVNSQGDTTHKGITARSTFGVTGAGIKIGVLSDGVNSLATSRSTGDVGPVTILPGQAGSGDEGTAILEIVHDVAPGAQLYFATAFGGVAGFAQNIRNLRTAGCDVILDDVSYFNESPFQDGPIAQAVNDVTAAGALYFASAGNAGNKDDNTSGVWEGDFVDSGTTIFGVTGGTFHDFDPSATTTVQNRIQRTTTASQPGTLFWSDPLGASANDYDLYLVNPAGTALEDASTDIQDGNDDPFEILTVSGASNGRRLAVFKATGAANRFIHVNANRQRFLTSGAVLGFSTVGQIHTHAAAADAFAVAATPANTAFGGGSPTGPYPNPFNSANLSETFTSDGPRHMFYMANGTPYTPDVSSTGGIFRQKPDITAADGVNTTVPGFAPFFGTSASAPHAGAIAALIKSANRSLTPAQIRTILTSTAIDIEGAGIDRDTGSGIVMAFEAVQSMASRPNANEPYIDIDSQTVAPASGDGDANLEPGETGTLNVKITNDGAVQATNINATLTTSTPNVLITQGSSAYPNLASLTSANNTTPFTFTILPNAPCFLNINFTLTVTDSGPNSPRVFNFSVPTGQPAATNSSVSYTGPPIAIPDNDDTAAISATVNVAGFGGKLADLNFRFDGTSCSTDETSTTVGLNHSFIGDLVITLKSPMGTTITLRNSDANAGHNFCQTTLDDSAATSIQSAPASSAPFTGSFKSAQALSTFNGEDPNGTWTLTIADVGPGDIGTLRAFSLILTPFACDASINPQRRLADFDKDSKADISVFRPSDGTWNLLQTTNGFTAVQWGLGSDKIVPGDYDGDGKIDEAVFRPSEGVWYILRSSDGQTQAPTWGLSTDTPVPGDYDGDSKTDVAVFRNGTWYILKSSNGQFIAPVWGLSNDKLVPGDYDGDGKTDLAIFRPSDGYWYILKSSNGQFTAIPWGLSTDKPVPADYDGDGKTDIAVYRNGVWHILQSLNGAYVTQVWGLSNDIPVPADYDGDGKMDVAVFRPSDNTWYIVKSTGGNSFVPFGLSGDIPVPSANLP